MARFRTHKTALGRYIAAHRSIAIAAGALLGLVCALLVILGALPAGLLREPAERRLATAFAAPVELGALTRDGFFSFTPEFTIHNLHIGQPEWAGDGDFVKVERASVRIPVFSLITGNVTIRSARISGLELALVRDEEGNSNWAGGSENGPADGQNPFQLEQLEIRDSRFSLRDARRRLDLSGQILADGSNGPTLSATGTFNGVPARLEARGGPLTNADPGASWPFEARLTSDVLSLAVEGDMDGALNAMAMDMAMKVQADSLKQLDHVIEAGLFGTQDIDFTGKVRRRGEDWFIDALDGTIGRSQISAEGSVLKRNGRSLIDATIHAAQLDFDDLADDAGLAEARAKTARIGPRVIPDTQIDLSNMGPTDGKLGFTIDRLLLEEGSAFRSFTGELTLEQRVLRLDNAEVGLESGQLTGWAEVDSTSRTPVFSTELRVAGSSLETLIGDPDTIGGPLDGLVRITGPGTTIREAFTNGNGKIAFVSSQGAVSRTAAYVLGRDLGGAISQELRDGDARLSLRCAVLGFAATDGVLRPDPLVIETEISSGRGSGQIDLDGETIAIVVNGITDDDPALELADPIRIAGSLSDPVISFAENAEHGSSGGGVLGAIGRSIGSALGLRGDNDDEAPRSTGEALDCRALRANALE